ncbi:tektin-like protein 1 [Saccoglossus kowalevskii]|uniref:Coiled-coil domain-containing protein 105-like n=1 Tax=Saccoglossus kowalevskii TaxID=10224 RepID=A0ABM0MRB4_SACKO|nr:PREDICTED: coiled-coil domain-containing protein 105-like [Saccoglossus kowalevskii]
MATLMKSRPQVPLSTAVIGPQSWRDASLKTIKVSQEVVRKSDKGCDLGRTLDPLPSLRDNCAQQSNEVVHCYVREARAVVVKLRESLVETNEEIKLLIRKKESLEKALEHKRKDIALNKLSMEVRLTRPSREKDQDGADSLLDLERKQLLQLKRMLEAQLRAVQKQLQVLDEARKRLGSVIQERSRVLDLLCHAASSVTNGRNSRNMHHAIKPTFGSNGLGYSRQVHFNMRNDGRRSSTPLPEDAMEYEPTRSYTPTLDPLGPYTPESAAAIAQAHDARNKSSTLRRDVEDAIARTEQLQRSAHKSVNDGLTQKLAETIALKQHLQVQSGENRAAVHRAQRWFDATEKAKGYTLGPESHADLTTRERLDRPAVRVFQRHPGTNLPEPQDIIRGAAGLDASLLATSRNIGMLHLARMRLDDDKRDKHGAASVDAAIIRLRRRRANHRWLMGSA